MWVNLQFMQAFCERGVWMFSGATQYFLQSGIAIDKISLKKNSDMGIKVWVVSVGILVTYCNLSLARSSAKPPSGSFVFGQNMGERVMVRVAKNRSSSLSIVQIMQR